MRRLLAAVVAVSTIAGAAGLAIAQGAAPGAAPAPGDAAAGAQVYGQYCAACHGPSARGGQAPGILGPSWRRGGSDEEVAASIRNGYPALGMPAWKGVVSEPQIRDIIAFLRSKAPGRTPPTAAEVAAMAPDPLPTGVVRTDAESFRVDKLAKVGPAYALAALPDGRLLVTEFSGALRFVDTRTGKVSAPVAGTPEGPMPEGAFQRRLLDVAVRADYPANDWVYLSWATQEAGVKGSPGQRIVLSRGRIRDGRWVDGQELFRGSAPGATAARIALDGKGHVFLTMASTDVISPPEDPAGKAQNLTRTEGKVLRFNEDGGVPADNPFVGRTDALPYVWSYGHRSPLGLAFDRNGVLWETENGPRGGDELNLILPGHNYGWPIITWGLRYDEQLAAAHPEEPGMDQPVVNWSPVPAISGMAFYSGKAFPRWRDNLFIASLRGRNLYRIVLSPANKPLVQEVVLANYARMRDVKTGADGFLYVLTEDGEILRFRPARG